MSETSPGEEEAASNGELAPLLPKEEASNTTTMPNFGTAIPADEHVTELDKARESMGEEEWAKRNQLFGSAMDQRLPPHIHLKTRREEYRKKGADKSEKLGCWGRFMVWLNAIDDINPILRGTLKDINMSFGSGISSVFYDWRWLILLNFLIWIVWFVFAIFPWLSNPPRFEHSSPAWASFWDRDDLSPSVLFGSGTEGKGLNSTTVAQDSFFFYTGYVPHMMSNSEKAYYPMGPAWVGCTIATMLLLFANINGRLIINLKMRKRDPTVESQLQEHMSTTDRVVGLEAQDHILGGYDYSSWTLEGQQGSVKALLTALESLLTAHYKELALPAHLRMGKEVFEIRCVVPGKSKEGEERPSIISYANGGREAGMASGDCVVSDAISRRKLEAGSASVVATDDELKIALEDYAKENPKAAELGAGDDADELSQKNTNKAVVKCVLQYGSLWSERNATKQETLIANGEFTPSKTWEEAAQMHRNQERPAFVFAIRHGEAVSNFDLAKQVIGIFLTLVCFVVSGTGVYAVTNYAKEVTEYGGPYAVTLTLVIIQNIIPVVVKLLVKWEGWSDEELVLRWTLVRVYFLKMANLVVLLSLLSKLGDQQGHCASLEVGMYLYQLVITGSIMSMAINWASFYATYKLAGEKSEYDNQTVAQQYIELNYNVALVWIGYVYSPMLPLVAALLGIMECAWLAQVLKWYCKCAEKPFQSTATTKMIVMTIFFITFAYSCIPTCTFLYNHPSVLWFNRFDASGNKILTVCGPIEATERRYQILVTFLLGWFPPVEQALYWATNPAILFGAIAILCVLVAFNSEATGMVREECVESYIERSNSEALLRERSIQNGILTSQKVALEEDLKALATRIADLEAGRADLSAQLEKKSKGFFGGGSGEKEKNKGGGCW